MAKSNDFAVESFETFVFRCPVFPINSREQHANSAIFKESIYLASPDLYKVLFSSNSDTTAKKNIKARLSAQKYLQRMMTRCTPFGLFSGCGIGKIGETNSIILNIDSFKSNTRLDMDLLYNLALKISSIPDISNHLVYYLNSSLYKLFDRYRYVEYKYLNKRKKYFISEANADSYLEKIITYCVQGVSKKDLLSMLLEDSVDQEEAIAYIESLIENQILISELFPTVAGKDPLEDLIKKLERKEVASSVLTTLTSIATHLRNIDSQSLGRNVSLYDKIEEDIQTLDVPYEKKFLFQSDICITPVHSTLTTDLPFAIKKCLRVLNKLNRFKESKLLNDFKSRFYERYEEEEISLAEALDSDIGVGFGNQEVGIDIQPLVDSLPYQNAVTPNLPQASYIDVFLLEKYMHCKSLSINQINITDDELSTFEENWADVPTTISVIAEVLGSSTTTSAPYLAISIAGGSSAANLLARFCHTNLQLQEHVAEILNKEEEFLQENELSAEILHLPESRTGNILFRPPLRSHEIPYLTGLSSSENINIPISDLFVSVKGGTRIVLRSRRLNKIISPRLTSAHNFSTNSLPIYHFLCLLQFQTKKANLSFSWGNLARDKQMLPRVTYEGVILYPATWNISSNMVKNIPGITHPDFFTQVQKFKEDQKIPDKALLCVGDNKLLIDFTDIDSTRLLFTEVKNQSFYLEETLFTDSSPLVKNGEYYHTNQVIFSFFKKSL